MTHVRLAPLMGLAMGAMIPAMVHGPMAGAGAAFVALHVLAGLALATLFLVFPAVRALAARHWPTTAMAGRMGLGVAFGFALVCSHCLITWHGGA